MFSVTDRMTMDAPRRTADGYLVAEAKFARSGLYDYAGSEVGKPDKTRVIVYRPEEEVFAEDAMASFAHRPLTNDHPADNVTAENWKRQAVGFTDGRVARDGDFVVVPMMVTDAETIKAVDDGKRELSAGYTCDLDFVDGETPEGKKYDAVMRNIRGNHIAIVDRGRAGSECRIGDSFRPTQEIKTMDLKKIMVDGLQVETTDAGEAAIRKLEGKIAAQDTAAAKANSDHTAELGEKDKVIAARDAEIEDLKGKVLDAAALDKLVADRANLVSTAGRIAPTFDCKGKTEAEIKRGVVAAKLGDSVVADKTPAYIDARYDLLVEALPTADGVDPLRATFINHGPGFSATDAAAAEEKARTEANDLNSWRYEKK
jgi:hypothetical protein